MSSDLNQISRSILEGNKASVVAGVTSALEQGIAADVILNEGMVPAMKEVGRLFEQGEYFIPEMLVSALAMQAGLEVLKPSLTRGEMKLSGKVVIGTIKGDLHDIGKNLVSMMLEGAAFEVIDLGADVPEEKFVEAVRSSGAALVAISALLTTTMTNMKSVIDALQAAGLRDQVKVMVGGAPLTEEFARRIGSDGYAADASRAVTLAQSLLT
jgi:5-methyltetrahydrofolate--homocysteine methyltransferase